jgi:hypothetical protein
MSVNLLIPPQIQPNITGLTPSSCHPIWATAPLSQDGKIWKIVLYWSKAFADRVHQKWT